MLRRRGIPDLNREPSVPRPIKSLDGTHANRKPSSDEWVVIGCPRRRRKCLQIFHRYFPFGRAPSRVTAFGAAVNNRTPNKVIIAGRRGSRQTSNSLISPFIRQLLTDLFRCGKWKVFSCYTFHLPARGYMRRCI